MKHLFYILLYILFMWIFQLFLKKSGFTCLYFSSVLNLHQILKQQLCSKCIFFYASMQPIFLYSVYFPTLFHTSIMLCNSSTYSLSVSISSFIMWLWGNGKKMSVSAKTKSQKIHVMRHLIKVSKWTAGHSNQKVDTLMLFIIIMHTEEWA